MSGRNHSARAQAEHFRQLADWTSDARTRLILSEMARELDELETREEEGEPGAAAPELTPPRSLS